jgi:hypothetical protein
MLSSSGRRTRLTLELNVPVEVRISKRYDQQRVPTSADTELGVFIGVDSEYRSLSRRGSARSRETLYEGQRRFGLRRPQDGVRAILTQRWIALRGRWPVTTAPACSRGLLAWRAARCVRTGIRGLRPRIPRGPRGSGRAKHVAAVYGFGVIRKPDANASNDASLSLGPRAPTRRR